MRKKHPHQYDEERSRSHPSLTIYQSIGEEGSESQARDTQQDLEIEDDNHESADLDLLTAARGHSRDDNNLQVFGITNPFHSPVSETGQLHRSINLPDALSPTDLSYLQDNWFPSENQMAVGVRLYFAHVSDYIPFLHPPTFDVTVAPWYLVFAVLALAYQHGEDPDSAYTPASAAALSLRCFHRGRVLAVAEEGNAVDLNAGTTVVQAYLLLQICAMMYLCGNEASYALKLHSRSAALARSTGLMHTLRSENSGGDLKSLWLNFVVDESRKRTVLAMHQLDALWYQFLSVPRLLSHLEIKQDLPCPRDIWLSKSETQWAHKQLLSGGTTSGMPYADTIRRFLAEEPDLDSLPAFDAYGAINITQFLISSAREISGWSTMTGRLSMERFEPLRSALVALQPFVSTGSLNAVESGTLLSQATWEMAMIELQIWSPSHTGGIVEGSIDRVLRQLAYLAPSYEFLIESNTAESIQPHVNWFLRYLDRPPPATEAPWVVLLTYKAFLIAWQLLKGGLPGVMDVVGVLQGDVEGARHWALHAFSQRRKQRLAQITMTCIEGLDR